MLNATNHIPSTAFHKRLLLIGAVMAFVATVLVLRTGQLTIAQGASLRELAENALVDYAYLPTQRGSILDRNGTVLAEDRVGRFVVVHYAAFLDEQWMRDRADIAVRMADNEADRDPLTQRERSAERRAMVWRTLDDLEQPPEAVLADFWNKLAEAARLDPDDLDARRRRISNDLDRQAAAVDRRRRRQHVDRYGAGALDDFNLELIAEEIAFHDILEIDDADEARFRALADETAWAGLIDVRFVRRRAYPVREAAATVTIDRSRFPSPLRGTPVTVPVPDAMDLIVGRQRAVGSSDIARRPFKDRETGVVDLGGYLPDDLVGSRGVEAAAEMRLRGMRGRRERALATGEEAIVAARRGADVTLTIDTRLQATMQGLLDPAVGLTRVNAFHQHDLFAVGTELDSAAVVIDIETREVLAMATYPTPALAPPDLSNEEAAAYYIHRAVDRPYEPGSILKPLVYVLGVRDGVWDVHSTHDCQGHYFPGTKDAARCWLYKMTNNQAMHGELDIEQAIGRSCNQYFFEVAAKLGLDGLHRGFSDFGIGSRLETGLAWSAERRDEETGEIEEYMIGGSRGLLPDPQVIRGAVDRPYQTVALGVGQGHVEWTPLHAANAYATLAARGRALDPVIVRGPDGDEPSAVNLRFDQGAIDEVFKGLKFSLNLNGTGYRIEVPDPDRPGEVIDERIIDGPFTAWGKTGTAQTYAGEDFRRRFGISEKVTPTHAWFVGLFGDQGAARPKYAVAVVVEYGGSGGKVAGPIANQVAHALVQHGYLKLAPDPDKKERPE